MAGVRGTEKRFRSRRIQRLFRMGDLPLEIPAEVFERTLLPADEVQKTARVFDIPLFFQARENRTDRLVDR